ncbi:MAG: CRP-like cAMP-binding protein [Akkermansiaceae bacterium]|jgi:CRP/FNR family cyclic AMP-dependent transcriptional regulator
MTDPLTNNELPAIGFAAEISAADRQSISSFGEFLPVLADSTLIVEGEAQESLYLVVSGLLHAHTLTDGRKTLLGRLKAGDVIGEVNIFDPGKASATVEAQEFCQVWRMSRSMFDEMLRDEPAVAGALLMSIAAQLSTRLRETNEKVNYVKKALFDPSFLS